LPRIFISYRRDDTASQAGRLFEHLREQFGQHHVFRDVDAIEPGTDFIDRLEREVASAAVVLAVIGPNWLAATDAGGRRRLNDPTDYVRREIAHALTNDIRVIPLLINGTPMPQVEEVPDDLAPLSRHNALELTDRYWKYGINELIETLEQLVGPAGRRVSEESPVKTTPESDPAAVVEREKAAFATAEALVSFFAKRGIDPERFSGEINELLKGLGDDAPLEAALAVKPDYRDLSGRGPFGFGESTTPGLLVASTSCLLFVIQGRTGIGFNTFAYAYNRLRQVAAERSRWRPDQATLFRWAHGVDLLVATYSDSTTFRVEKSFEEDLRAILNATHSRTPDGVVNLSIPEATT